MDRATFIKKFGLGAALSYGMWNGAIFSASGAGTPTLKPTDDLIRRLVDANDAHVQQLLEIGDQANRHGGRSLGYNFAKMAAAYHHHQSRFRNDIGRASCRERG